MRGGHFTVITTLSSNSHSVIMKVSGKSVPVLRPDSKFVKKATPTHLGDAQPDVLVRLRVAEAEPQLLGFVGIDVEPLEITRRAAGVDCVDFLSVAEHVQAPGSLGTPVEGD